MSRIDSVFKEIRKNYSLSYFFRNETRYPNIEDGRLHIEDVRLHIEDVTVT